MDEHVKVLGWLGVARSVLALALALLLLVKSENLGQSSYGFPRVSVETVEFDQLAFRWVGGLCFFFSVLRVIQGALALLGRSWARRFGLALAMFDLVNLALFPVSTALGLYGLVVYRHPDTLDHFAGKRRAPVNVR